MTEERLHQGWFVVRIFGAEEKAFVIAFENGNARKLPDHLQTFVVPRAVIHYIAQAHVGIDIVPGGAHESLEREQISVNVAKHGHSHGWPAAFARFAR